MPSKKVSGPPLVVSILSGFGRSSSTSARRIAPSRPSIWVGVGRRCAMTSWASSTEAAWSICPRHPLPRDPPISTSVQEPPPPHPWLWIGPESLCYAHIGSAGHNYVYTYSWLTSTFSGTVYCFIVIKNPEKAKVVVGSSE